MSRRQGQQVEWELWEGKIVNMQAGSHDDYDLGVANIFSEHKGRLPWFIYSLYNKMGGLQEIHCFKQGLNIWPIYRSSFWPRMIGGKNWQPWGKSTTLMGIYQERWGIFDGDVSLPVYQRALGFRVHLLLVSAICPPIQRLFCTTTFLPWNFGFHISFQAFTMHLHAKMANLSCLGIWWSLALAQQNIPMDFWKPPVPLPPKKEGGIYLGRVLYCNKASWAFAGKAMGFHPPPFCSNLGSSRTTSSWKSRPSNSPKTMGRVWATQKTSKRDEVVRWGGFRPEIPCSNRQLYNNRVSPRIPSKSGGKVILIDADPPCFTFQTRSPLRSVFGCGSFKDTSPGPQAVYVVPFEARQLEDQIVTLSNGVSRQAPAYIEASGGSVTWSGKNTSFKAIQKKTTTKNPQEQWIINFWC